MAIKINQDVFVLFEYRIEGLLVDMKNVRIFQVVTISFIRHHYVILLFL
jgi:hypothetical protein